MDLFLASIRNMKWLRNIFQKNAGKTKLSVFRGLRIKKVELKSLFNKVAGLMICNFIKKKNSGTVVFL